MWQEKGTRIKQMASIREMILADYQERILTVQGIPDDLRRALKDHERVPLFVENLTREIKKIEQVKPKFKMDRVKLKSLVYDMTDVFWRAVKTTAEDKYKSEIERQIKSSSSEDLFKGLDAQGNGFISELGVEVVDGQNRKG
jgi:bacterioferritin (cytochrome b1)